MAWLGILAYTFQIYFDFSSYSDMAIGIGKIIGFSFPENFDNPYNSRSITEFWRRWHMTLGDWMKNYLYIPLGGNQVSSKSRLYSNLILVFLLSGLWHGASWNFIIWGAFHGFFLVIERMFFGTVLTKLGKLPSIIITFLIVNFGWVFFRVEKIKDAFSYIQIMFSFKFHSIHSFDSEFKTYFLIALFFSFFAISNYTQKIQNAIYFNTYTNTRHLLICFTSICLFVLSISSITSSGFNPFIYFRF
jgi:alginate O-acetyltransferase complex protein AlgI